MSNRTHYRKVFKSDHLSSYDLEDFIEQGRPLEFTISNVKQEYSTKVAGRKIDANIAYFIEPIKPMVLNAGNSKIIENLVKSPFVEDWNNVSVELYIQKNINFGKETVQGIRIKESAPIAITEKDIKMLKAKVALITDNQGLNKFYSSLTPKEKTNKYVIELLKEKQTDLKQS